MSQILKAIDKAEKERKEQSTGASNRDALYKDLAPPNITQKQSNKWLLTVLFLAVIACVTTFFYFAQVKSENKTNVPLTKPITPLPQIESAHSHTNTQTNPALKKPVTKEPTEKSSQDNTQHTDTKKTQPIGKETSTKPQQTYDKNKLAKLTEIQPTQQEEPHKALQAKTNQTESDSTQKNIIASNELATLKPIMPNNLIAKESSDTGNKAKSDKTGSIAESETQKEVSGQEAVPSWKKDISITAIVNHPIANKRFVLIKGTKVFEGGVIPNTNFTLIKILPQAIIINDGNGDIMLR